MALRWLHVLLGTIWIGLLYSSNLRGLQAAAPDTDYAPDRRREPLWLGDFPWSAGGTVLFGAAYLALVERHRRLARLALSPYETTILTGSALGVTMFINALVFWLARKRPAPADLTRALARRAPAVREADRRAMLATRTNVLLSIPMLFFMVAASHYRLFPHLSTAQATAWFATVGSTIVVLELNALLGLGKTGERLLGTVGGAVGSGFAVWALLFVISKMLFV